MALTIDHFVTKNGEPLAGFAIRNSRGKAIAYGTDGFVCVTARRYIRDWDLCRRIHALTGQAPRYRDKTHPRCYWSPVGYMVSEDGQTGDLVPSLPSYPSCQKQAIAKVRRATRENLTR